MAKQNILTRIVAALRDAPMVHLLDDGTYSLVEGMPEPTPGGYAVIPVDDAEGYIKDAIRADARTRIDPRLRKRRAKKAVKKTAKARK